MALTCTHTWGLMQVHWQRPAKVFPPLTFATLFPTIINIFYWNFMWKTNSCKLFKKFYTVKTGICAHFSLQSGSSWARLDGRLWRQSSDLATDSGLDRDPGPGFMFRVIVLLEGKPLPLVPPSSLSLLREAPQSSVLPPPLMWHLRQHVGFPHMSSYGFTLTLPFFFLLFCNSQLCGHVWFYQDAEWCFQAVSLF